MIIVGIDSPLGFPNKYIELVNGNMVSLVRPEKEINNEFAYRETERYIYKTFNKKPLSATFDKLGNNCTVAISNVYSWCKNDGYSLHPRMTNTDDQDEEWCVKRLSAKMTMLK